MHTDRNHTHNQNDSVEWGKGIVYVLGVLGLFLIVWTLLRAMEERTRPPATNQARAEERYRAAQELNAAGAEAVNSTGYIDKGKGTVRLTVKQAMDLSLAQSANPAAARSNLLSRLEKATAVPAKAPEKPSAFE